MKTIAVHSTKGGTGKSTLSVIILNALAGAGHTCLAVDTDMINHSLSFSFNAGVPYEKILEKNIFKVFTGEPVDKNILPVRDRVDLLHADVRLSDFRSIETFKRMKSALGGLAYDYAVIDTAPAFDNIIVNVLTASDTLIIPVQQDVFNYQSLKYLFKKLEGLELADLDTHIVLNQYEKPRTENKAAYKNQLIDLFTEDVDLAGFINPVHVSKSGVIRKYINDQGYRINARGETKKQYDELISLIQSVIGVTVQGDI